MRCMQCGINASPQVDFYKFCKAHEKFQCPDCDVTKGFWLCANCCQREDTVFDLDLSNLTEYHERVKDAIAKLREKGLL